MDGLGIGHLGGGDDGGHVQIALGGGRRPDADGFVGQAHVLGLGVGLGIHGHGLDAHLAAGALDAQGDFAAIGDEDFFKHGFVLREESGACGGREGEGGGSLSSPHLTHVNR
jgi:hypothetical protein